jgi:hypothetical protein
VPRRTNIFQRVIKTVYEHQSDNPVMESEMVRDPTLDAEREVDVMLTETVAGEEIKVGVEVTATNRPLALPAVQALIAKHQGIGTDRVIIVSRSGFTAHALRAIEAARGISGYQPKDLTDPKKFEAKIVGELSTLWQKRFSVTLTDVWAEIELPRALWGTQIVPWVHPPPYFDLLDSKGNEVVTPEQLFVDWAQRNGKKLAEILGVAETPRDRKQTFQYDLLAPWTLDDKDLGDLYVNVNTSLAGDPPTPEPLKLVKLDLRGPAVIRVSRFDLQHRQLHGGLAYSIGETEIDGEHVLMIVSASPKGEKITTLPLGGRAGRRKPAKRKGTRHSRVQRR